jgi:hypothetical protein
MRKYQKSTDPVKPQAVIPDFVRVLVEHTDADEIKRVARIGGGCSVAMSPSTTVCSDWSS